MHESLKKSVHGKFVHVGAGYGFHWHVIETAFESHILTGVKMVINISNLADANKIVLEHVHSVMQRYDSLKINTIFNGEFVVGETRE